MSKGNDLRWKVQRPVAEATGVAVGSVVGVAAGVREGLDDTIGRGKTTALLLLLGLFVIVIVGAYFPDPRILALSRAKELSTRALEKHTPFPMPATNLAMAEDFAGKAATTNAVGNAGIPAKTTKLKDLDCPYKELFQKYGAEYDIPYQLIAGVCWHESAFNPKAVSRDGYNSRGLGQPIPETWAMVTKPWKYTWLDAFDPEKNIRFTADYLNRVRKAKGCVLPGMTEADVAFAMYIGYNCGASYLATHSRDDAPLATRRAAAKILKYCGYLD